MKGILISLLFLVSTHVLGGGYYNPTIDYYDSYTGLYFKSVSVEEESGFFKQK